MCREMSEKATAGVLLRDDDGLDQNLAVEMGRRENISETIMKSVFCIYNSRESLMKKIRSRGPTILDGVRVNVRGIPEKVPT